jgi:hypothetical protein
MRERALAFAILGIDVGHGRRARPAPGAIIDGVGPQASGLGPAAARVEHRQRRVVGEELGRGEDALEQALVQGLQPPAGAADPVRQRRAVELDAVAGEDLRLAVQGPVVRVLVDQHLGDQRLAGHAAVDRALGGGRLDHRPLACPTAVTGAADDLDPVLDGDDVEHLGDVLADHVQRPAAARAGLVLDVDHDLDARQMPGQGTAVAPRLLAPSAPLRHRRRRLFAGLGRGHRLLDVLEPELQLVGIEALRAAAELQPLELGEQQAQLLDLARAALEARRLQGDHLLPGLELAGECAHGLVQKRDVGRETVRIDPHEA